MASPRTLNAPRASDPNMAVSRSREYSPEASSLRRASHRAWPVAKSARMRATSAASISSEMPSSLR